MTADVELPKAYTAGEFAKDVPVYDAPHVRAIVHHATAAKDAEIERLRAENKDLVKSNEQVQKLALDTLADRDELKAEIEALRVELDRLRGEHVRVRRDRNAKAARAERLAEALRELVALGHPRDPAIIAAKNALRDHDQERKDG